MTYPIFGVALIALQQTVNSEGESAIDFLKFMHSKEANFNATCDMQDVGEVSLLGYAIYISVRENFKLEPIAKLLIEYGADINHRSVSMITDKLIEIESVFDNKQKENLEFIKNFKFDKKGKSEEKSYSNEYLKTEMTEILKKFKNLNTDPKSNFRSRY
ncbi:MAG: hypothetical protein ACK4OM_00235 [Alphaproteobacteria bacterium]